jgi:DNA-binding NarL/FixJ family response regulator
VTNIRDIKGLNDDELRASLKAAGWNEHLPAIKDEDGNVIVGNRRMAIAEQEGIEPIIKVVIFGNGAEAQAARIRLANVSNIGAAPLKAQDRKRQAENLYKGGLTQQAIASMLGVSQRTISADLETLEVTSKVNDRQDRLGRKNTGRPKGRPQKAVEREDKVAALKDEGLTVKEIARAVGLGERAVNQALEHVEIKRSVTPEITREELNLTQQKRADIYIRKTETQLRASFQKAVNDEVRHRLDEIILPDWKKKIDEAKKIYSLRRKFMSKETFNMIRRGLHPDSRHSISDKKLAEAFDAFMALEKFLLDEEASPTELGNLPDNLAAWDKMKANARTAKRSSGQTAVRRR